MSAGEGQAPRRAAGSRLREPLMLLAAVAVTVLSALPVFLVGAMSVQMRVELGFDEARLGLTVTAFFLMSALGSTPAGRVTERVGAYRAMVATAALSAVALLGVALVARSWPQLLAFMMVGGLASGLGPPAVNLVLARGVSAARQGLAFGVKQAAIPVATLLAGAAVPLIALTVGWRWAFVSGAAAALTVMLSLRRVIPADHRAVPVRRVERLGDRDALAALVLLAAGGAFGGASVAGLAVFLVPYGVAAGMAEGSAGLLLSFGSMVGVAARVVSGWRADARGGGHFRAVSLMLLGGAVGFLLLAWGGAPSAIVAGTALGFGAGWGWNGLYNFAVVNQFRHAPAAATGVAQTGIFVGGVVGPSVFGLAVTYGSYRTAWLVSAALIGAAATLVLLGRRLLRRRRVVASSDRR